MKREKRERSQIDGWIIENQYFTVAQVAALLQVSQTTVRRMVSNGQLRSRRVGNAIRFNRLDIKKFDESIAFRPDGGNDSSGGVQNC